MHYTLIILILLLLIILFLLYQHFRMKRSLRAIEDGTELLRAQDMNTRLRRTGNASTDHIVDMFNTMMNQLKEERLQVREHNRFLDLLISCSPMGVVIYDFDGHITSCNKSALTALGYTNEEELKGLKMSEVQSVLASAIAEIPLDDISTVRLSDFHIYRVSHLSFIDHGFKHPFVLIESFTDELVKAEKRAYEKVIRMIAHEVNNTVAGINSMLEQMKAEDTDTAARDDSPYDALINRSNAMSSFITRFADVVKLPEPKTAKVSLNTFIKDTLPFLETLCSQHSINIHLHLEEPSPTAMIDTTLMEQALLNIVKNAAESIGNGGDITITTASHPTTLEITDNGRGITPEQQLHLFTPFYSTKRDGQGIGLLIIRETLMRHNCTFSLRTYPDDLTRFRIEFNG
ncbi:MAG: PAS domain-containing protein [Bacteroidaceae bacterium]|nr:PAS domain-containing protein [Bacteroidaceae bacterium]